MAFLIPENLTRNDVPSGFTWKAAGINTSGRTRVLDVSYRNTKEILECAHRSSSGVATSGSMTAGPG